MGNARSFDKASIRLKNSRVFLERIQGIERERNDGLLNDIRLQQECSQWRDISRKTKKGKENTGVKDIGVKKLTERVRTKIQGNEPAKAKIKDRYRRGIRHVKNRPAILEANTSTRRNTSKPRKLQHVVYEPRPWLQVFFRKRPMNKKERKSEDFDVVSISSKGERAAVYDCRMHADMVTPEVTPYTFKFPQGNDCRFFSEKCSSDEVYTAAVRPLVLHSAVGGSLSTVFLFGQTGSGKTHTMNAICTRAACDIYELDRLAKRQSSTIRVSGFELNPAGQYRDLLTTTSTHKIRLLENENGEVGVHGLSICTTQNAPQLNSALQLVLRNRKSARTGVHAASSRSHAIIAITFPNNAVLLMIDLAGSERHRDSALHSQARMLETKEVNSSLHALKECLRARQNGHGHIPFRQHRLTQILKASFDGERAKTCVIGTLSPCASDTEHTMSTLNALAFSSD
mmetsp:Transcript_2565/g.5001  ORF Transcript_2565/g.5001 Transcript_2565/m.5001 type:complete len:457 (-) Transcript_2565:2745-4115(-)